MLGDSDTWLLHGQPSIYTAPHDTVAWQIDPQGTDPNHLRITATGGDAGDDSHTLHFATPGPLAPGRYAGATRYSFQPSATPAWTSSTETRGCNESTGEFTIHDIAADRLWLTYVHYCDDELPVFGEVRIGLPHDGPLQVTARSIASQAAWLGETAAPTAPVELVNTGDAPLGVASAAVLAGGSDFTVRDNTCTSTLAPGARCRVADRVRPLDTRRTPREPADHRHHRRGDRRRARGLRPRGPHVLERRQRRGRPGRCRGHVRLQPRDGGVVPGPGQRHRGARAARPGHRRWWRADFAAPAGQTLVAGTTYAGAVLSRSDPTRRRARRVRAGNGRVRRATGAFTVHELRPTRRRDRLRPPHLLRAALRRDTGVPALTGRAALGADDPTPRHPDTTGPAPVTGSSPSDGRPGPTSPGPTRPRRLGRHGGHRRHRGPPGARTIYAGRGASALVTGLDPAHDSSIEVRSRDTSGNLGADRASPSRLPARPRGRP